MPGHSLSLIQRRRASGNSGRHSAFHRHSHHAYGDGMQLFRPWMGVAVHVEQIGGVHLRIDLRGTEARMAKQLLQRSQVRPASRSEENTSELQSLMRISYA